MNNKKLLLFLVRNEFDKKFDLKTRVCVYWNAADESTIRVQMHKKI